MNESIYYLVDELHTAINGDKGTKGFDGLDTLLVGTSTEINADASKAIDLSTSAAMGERVLSAKSRAISRMLA